MSDKVGVFLSLVAFIIIAIVVSKNYNFAADEVQFTEGGFYVAGTPADRQMSEKQLLAQMNSARNVQCPQTHIAETTNGLCRIAVYNKDKDNKWRNEYFFIPNYWLKDKEVKLLNPQEAYWTDADKGASTVRSACEMLNINAAAADTTGVTLNQLCGITEYCELVAPFQFVFENLNTTSRHDCTQCNVVEGKGSCEKIVIVSKDGKCRIIFDHVANWFCAGEIGKEGEATSTEWDDVTESYKTKRKSWDEHATGQNVHYSVMGNSGNSTVSGGGAGIVIGYGKPETTVKIEYLSGSTWTELTVHKWFVGLGTN